MDLDTLFNQHSAQTDAAFEGLVVPPFEDAQRRHRQRGIRMAVATFGAVALVAGVVLLIPRATDLPVAEESSTPTAPATTTTVVTDDPVALSGVELIASQWTSHRLGTDPLAVDTLTAELMGFVARDIGYLHYCGELDLGCNDLAQIDVTGNVDSEGIRRDFAPHPDQLRQLEWRRDDAADLIAQGGALRAAGR